VETGIKPVPQADTSSPELDIRKKRLRDNCREFESVMVSYLMKTMRDGVIKAEEPEHAQTIFEEMLDGQISKTLANKSALGIGDMLYARLEHLVNDEASKGTPGGESVSSTAVDPALPETTVPDTAYSGAGSKELP
jgi:Rod binding domain-containing protein